MANSEVESLMKAQLKREETTVQDMARRLGVNYALSIGASDVKSAAGVDRVELADFLCNGVLVEFWNQFGVARYRLEPGNDDQRIASATVCVHRDSLTIEVIVLRMKGELK